MSLNSGSSPEVKESGSYGFTSAPCAADTGWNEPWVHWSGWLSFLFLGLCTFFAPAFPLSLHFSNSFAQHTRQSGKAGKVFKSKILLNECCLSPGQEMSEVNFGEFSWNPGRIEMWTGMTCILVVGVYVNAKMASSWLAQKEIHTPLPCVVPPCHRLMCLCRCVHIMHAITFLLKPEGPLWISALLSHILRCRIVKQTCAA